MDVPYTLSGKKVWIAGQGGMVGQALTRRLAGAGAELLTTSRAQVDLRRQDQVETWMQSARPQAIFLAAATVGGILANDTRPAEFLYDNLMIEANIIHAAAQTGVEKLLFLGSSCIYPKFAQQPINEAMLLTGPLEPTNEWYAVAKIAGIKLAQAYRKQHGCDFISAMPTNLFGYGDLFDLNSGHVIPALMMKIHEAKSSGGPVPIWGTGMARREFLFSEDLADALVYLMENYTGAEHVNVGTGEDIPISELATCIGDVVGYTGGFEYDTSKPDGTPRKLLDVSKVQALGWRHRTGLKQGLQLTYDWFVENHDNLRKMPGT